MNRKDLLPASLAVTAGVLLGGIALLMAAYGLNLFSFPATWWRDHPFDFGNILHTTQTFSFTSRFWAYDPYHLFGWVPNVFYNPLATAAAGLFVSLFGSTEGAYRAWLLLLLFGTSLAFLPLLPRDAKRGPWVAGGLIAALLSLVVYPRDVGILDANPVQVLYTGQWAQRLGLALGILAVGFVARALESPGKSFRQDLQKILAAAALLGAATFCHYMSGYAAAAAGALLSVFYLLGRRLTKGDWSFRSLLVLPAALLGTCLLFLDFFYVFLSLSGSHHDLPLLGWRVSEGALETVREVIIPALPILLIPLVRMSIASGRSRPELSKALLPLLVLLAAVAATPESLLGWFSVVLLSALVASRLEREFRPRHWLPVTAFFLLLLSCGPDSLRVFGLDLSSLVPFSGSIGWAKLAAFSRWLFLAWLGVLTAEGLGPGSQRRRRTGRILALGLVLLGLSIPILLSATGGKSQTGAQSYFARMNRTDRETTRSLLLRMQGVATRTPRDGYLLVEDTLHHPKGSGLPQTIIPNGHLPYLIGRQSGRPVLGGAVTTRLITHPLAHTSRGQLLCRDLSEIQSDPAPVMDRLRSLGVSDILAHSQELIAALRNYPAALEVDTQAGLTHFALEHYRPILTDADGLHLDGGQLRWHPDGLEVELPAGTSTARLRQVYYPFLRCSGKCRLSAWTEGPERFSGCLIDDPRIVEVEIPWIRIDIAPDPQGPTTLRIFSRPSLLPWVIMLAAWIGMIAARLLFRRRARSPTP
jgi:hypothetical protein